MGGGQKNAHKSSKIAPSPGATAVLEESELVELELAVAIVEGLLGMGPTDGDLDAATAKAALAKVSAAHELGVLQALTAAQLNDADDLTSLLETDEVAEDSEGDSEEEPDYGVVLMVAKETSATAGWFDGGLSDDALPANDDAETGSGPEEDLAPEVELAEALADELLAEDGPVSEGTFQPLAAPTSEISAATWDEALTPVPDSVALGDPRGTSLLVGGDDVEGQSVTILAYDSAKGPREVLFAVITPEAEQKILEAIGVGLPTTEITVLETKVGRLDVDTTNQIFEKARKLSMDVNRALKHGQPIAADAPARLEALQGVLAKVWSKEGATEGEEKMVAHYTKALDLVTERLQPGWSLPFAEGGKMPYLEAFQGEYEQHVVKQVPVPLEQPVQMLAHELRPGSRLAPTIESGTLAWAGGRSPAGGKEYAIDLGDGCEAIYHPYDYPGHNPASDPFTIKGRLEIVAPPGGGHAKQLVGHLGKLNLVNRPMTKAEGEWAYLQANIVAQGLSGNAKVQAAMTRAEGLADAVDEIITGQIAQQVITSGAVTSDTELMQLAREIRLEAEAKALPDMVRIVRDGVAKAKGLSGGDDLVEMSGYDPTPRHSGSWLTWDRFDVVAAPAEAKQLFGEKNLYHHSTGGWKGLLDMFTNGGMLAATERRRALGTHQGIGMSESSDIVSGGANSVFTRVGSIPKSYKSHGPLLVWDDPTVLLRRADWYAYGGDHFGATNTASHWSTSGQTRQLKTVAGYGGGGNEVMFRDGIDLLGNEAPSRVITGSAAHTKELLALLKTRGVTEIGGRPVAEVVMT